MKKQILSLGLCATLLSTQISAHILKRYQSIDEIMTVVKREDKNNKETIIVIPSSIVLTVDTKILQDSFQDLQNDIINLTKTEKDQKNLETKLEQLGQTFVEKIVQATTVNNPELVETIKQLYDIKDIKIVFISNLPPAVAPVLVSYLAECGIKTADHAVLQDDMFLQNTIKGQTALCGIHIGGILFVGDINNTKTAISAMLKQAKTKTTYTVHMLNN